jgi:hypothetical protein
LDENGKVIGEAILTEDGFKFELLGTQENYNFKLENYPENLDLAEIPIEFTINGNKYKITANFKDDNPFTFSTKEIKFKKNFGYNSYQIDLAKVGKIHPILRTILIPSEFAKVKNRTIKCHIGLPLDQALVKEGNAEHLYNTFKKNLKY